MRLWLSAVAFVAASLSAAAQTSVLPYQDPSLSPQQRAADLVSRMTLEEKAAQSINTAPAVPRLGVPAYDYWSEGLHGVARSGYATLFPQAVGMAATFDAPLLHDFGTVVSTEARAKYNEAVRNNVHSIYFGLTIWSPNINIFRDPRWGRGQETYGEDPFLTATLGVNFVRGLQGDDPKYYRVIATPKHYAVHSGPESDRHRFDVTPSEHDLWDTYLPAFRATIVDAKADSIMCAYNALYGKPACASDLLLGQILRRDWNFKGFVTSDCGAVDDFWTANAHRYSADKEHAAAAGVLSGTDTNCGDTYLALPQAVQKGLLKESDLNKTLERLFEARIRLGLFDPPAQMPYSSLPFSEVGSPAHKALALKAAKESIVLLKNDNHTLPLLSSVHSIAVVGPNASDLSAVEGNYNAVPKDPMMPLDGIQKEFPHAHVSYAQGSPYAEGLPLPIPPTQFHPSANSREEGLKAEYFANDHWSGAAAATRIDKQIDFDWNSASPVPAVPQNEFSVRWTGTFTAPAPVDIPMTLKLAHCFPCRDYESVTIAVDGQQLTTFSTKESDANRSSTTPIVTLHLSDTHPHAIEVTYAHRAALFGGGLTLSWIPPASALLEQAKAAAVHADAIVAFVGLSPELEGEEMPIHTEGFSGGDRTNINLPAAQGTLLEAMVATGKPLIVVSMSGSAIAYTWAQQHAAALLQAWYPGEAGAQAIAETLSGKNNPSGRLPVTFYASTDELPSFTEYSMKNRTYRYFTGKPLYGFGYGLSYTSFKYSNLKLSSETVQAGTPLEVECDVINNGSKDGDEVAELYLIPPASDNGGLSPKLQLEGFNRIHLAAGETKHIHFALDARQLSEVDAHGTRAVRAGKYTIAVGGSQPGDTLSASTPQSASFSIQGQSVLPH